MDTDAPPQEYSRDTGLNMDTDAAPPQEYLRDTGLNRPQAYFFRTNSDDFSGAAEIPLFLQTGDAGWRRLIGSLIFMGHFPHK